MDDTICAISTALGVGAISIIRVSGSEAISKVANLFDGKNLNEVKSHTIHYGHIISNGEIIDEVLVTILKAPKTYTKEDIVEINSHGGISTTKKILEILIENGIRLAEPGEFTKRAFLNGRLDLTEAEAVNSLIKSRTDLERKLALNTLSGKVSKKINKVREIIVELLANIEVNIDYPEYIDELEITKENITPVLTEIKNSLQKIVEESENGKKIKEGINIAIIGRPNVGKSSLLNALLEEDKAIVTDISGTTRDIVEGTIQYKGINLNFIDTAGIRETEDIVEKIGVEKSKKIQESSDITILVLNNNELLTEEDKELLKKVEQEKGVIFINKIDLASKLPELKTTKKLIKGSTVKNVGLEELKEEILSEFSLEDMSYKDLTYLFNTRQISLAKQALQNINHVIEENKKDIPVDMLAIEIRESWEYLGQIIGEAYEDELVDNIFKRFCLGK